MTVEIKDDRRRPAPSELRWYGCLLAPVKRRLVKAAFGLGTVLLAVYAVQTVVPVGGGELYDRVTDTYLYCAVYAVAAALLVARAWLISEERLPWLLLAVGGILTILGWIAYDTVVSQRDPIPYPSIADALWLPLYACAFVAIVLLIRSRLRGFHAGAWLDGLTAGLMVSALGAAAVFEPVLRSTQGGAATVATGLAYPLGDLLILGSVLAVLALHGWHPGKGWMPLLLAFSLQAGADVFYLLQTAEGSYVRGTPLDIVWPAAQLLIAYAAWVAPSRVGEVSLERWPVLALPLVFAVGALVLLVLYDLDDRAIVVLLAAGALVAALARSVLTFRETRDVKLLAREDPLTGLRNHREFHQAVERQVATGKKAGERFGIVLFDLDGFKQINDLRGHAEGDRVLRLSAAALRAACRAEDLPGRLGGDEFGLLLPGLGAGSAGKVAERIARAIAGGDAGVSASYGVAEWPVDGLTKDMLLLRADVALYAAKRDSARRAAGQGDPESRADARETPEEAQLRAYAEAVRTSYARELAGARELRETYLATVKTLAAAVEAKDDYTGGHIQRVHELGRLLAARLVPEDADDDQLAYGFLLHDIGKLSVPDAVLTKPGKLSEEEWELMRRHPEEGARILASVPFLTRALDIVLFHHERWDGQGYPHGLAGEAIPLWARLFAIVDTVDAMTSDRPYRAGLPLDTAIEELRKQSGRQFDPRCVEAFAALDRAEVERLLERHRPATSQASMEAVAG